MLLISEDQKRLGRWSAFLTHFDVNLMLAPSVEVAKQFFEAIPVDVAMVDAPCWHVSRGLRRNQSDVFLIKVAARSADATDADFTMLDPIDLFVLEEALEHRIGIARSEDRRGPVAAAEQSSRERERMLST